MAPALSNDLRWRIVWAAVLDGQSRKEIAEHLQVSKRSMRRIVQRSVDTGNVYAATGTHGGLPRVPWNKVMTYEQDMKLLELVTTCDDKTMLTEI